MSNSRGTNVKIEVLKFKSINGNDGLCIEAVISVNGHKMAVFDDGNGGALEFHAAHPYGRAPNAKELGDQKSALDALEAEAKRIGKIECPEMPKIDGKVFSYKCDAEHLVNEVFTAHLQKRDLTRALKTKVLFQTPGKGAKGALYEVSFKFKGRVFTLDQVEAELSKKHDKMIVLNRLPIDQALAIYARAG